MERKDKLRLEYLKIKEVSFRYFADIDWSAFAGAENFSNGADPLICYEVPAKRDIGLGYNSIVVILDGKGIEISGNSKSGNKTVAYAKQKKFNNPASAKSWFYNVIKIPVNKIQLKELGFEKYRIN